MNICMGFPGRASGKKPTYQCRLDIKDMGSVPGLGRSPGGEHGNPLQPRESHGRRSWGSCKSMGVAHSWTWLKWLNTHTDTCMCVAESLHQARETTTTLLIGCTPVTGGKGPGHNFWKNDIAQGHDTNRLKSNESKMADKSTLSRPWPSISKLSDTTRGTMTVPKHCQKTKEWAVAQSLETSTPSQN